MSSVLQKIQEYVEANAHDNRFACPLCAFECDIPSGGVEELQTNFYIKAAQAKLKIAANSKCEVKKRLSVISLTDSRFCFTTVWR